MTIYKKFKNPSQMTQEEQQKAGAAAIGTVVTFFIKPIIVKSLWNWLMPTLFGIAAITYWQAMGLGLLISLLFKNHNESN